MPKQGSSIEYWSEQEDNFLIENIGNMTYAQIAVSLHRPKKGVATRAKRLGLTEKTKMSMTHLPRDGFKSTLVVKASDIERRADAYLENGDLLNITRELAEMKAIRDISREWLDGFGATPETLQFYVRMNERVAKMIKEAAVMIRSDLPTRSELQQLEGTVVDIVLEYVPQSRQKECADKIERAFRLGREDK